MNKSEKVKKPVLKVLEIGPFVSPQARHVPGWEEAEILSMDVVEDNNPDILCDAGDIPEEYWGQFDGVLASHVLEHFSWYLGSTVLEHWVQLLKPGGQLHIVVPSAEWAARQTLSENPSPAVLPHSYGGSYLEYDVHKTMYTMLLLRKYFDEVGLMVEIATTAPYTISVNKKPYQAEQHYIMGVKPLEE